MGEGGPAEEAEGEEIAPVGRSGKGTAEEGAERMKRDEVETSSSPDEAPTTTCARAARSGTSEASCSQDKSKEPWRRATQERAPTSSTLTEADNEMRVAS
eukprot:5760736-Karenia_brevis.AAC.1